MLINEVTVSATNWSLQNIRIRHTIILDDPFPTMPGLGRNTPHTTPEITDYSVGLINGNWTSFSDNTSLPDDEFFRDEAKNKAIVLEIVGDLPGAQDKPPNNVLFICKLNPLTKEKDLEVIFAQCGQVIACNIIRDWKTRESLNYGFIGFDSDIASERAYFKMNNIVIDDRRIKVDFSQSVAHLW